jgi:phosphoribosylformylglycinamidine synthase
VLKVSGFRGYFEKTATMLEKKQLQSAHALADAEHQMLVSLQSMPKLQFDVWQDVPTLHELTRPLPLLLPLVAVIRGEGSNGHREMQAALFAAGFEVHDMTTSDLTDGRVKDLDKFKAIVFPGGFTYSDVLGSAVGWEIVLNSNTRASKIINDFRNRPDTFVLGVCNGCQLLSRLGWVHAKLEHNNSKRFESRFVTVQFSSATSDKHGWFDGLHNRDLGVWIAHGEGKFETAGPAAHPALRYVNPLTHQPTEEYPFNPNGSAGGVAGVFSADGRVLAMMPHPERCFKNWQLPWKNGLTNPDTPWMRFFQNFRMLCSRY